jgi:hypothetical protein
MTLSSKNVDSLIPPGEREGKKHDSQEARKLDNFFNKGSEQPAKPGGSAYVPRTQNKNAHTKKKGGEPVAVKKHGDRITYAERVQMDRFLAQPEFRIKSSGQLLYSILSVFRSPPDKVCRYFIVKRLPKICDMLEQLISAVRIIFPRNNLNKNTTLQKHSSFSYKVLNVIRHWNISRIAAMTGFLQNHAGNVYLSDLRHLIRLIYQPIFILDAVDADGHMPFILKDLYRQFPPKDDTAESNKARKKNIETVTRLYKEVSHEICYVLYPLLMKLACKKWYNYSTFMTDHRQEVYAFLEIKETDCVVLPERFGIASAKTDDTQSEEKKAEPEAVVRPKEKSNEEDSEDQRLKQVMQDGLKTLEILFPGSGWNQPEYFPDFYQYFVHVYDFKKNVDCIHPQNPLLQLFVLAQILEDIFHGWHSMISVPGKDVNYPLGRLIIDWQEGFEKLVYRNYLKLLSEYYGYYSLAAEFRQKAYGEKITNEIKCFTKSKILPFYEYTGPGNVDLPAGEYDSIFNKIDALYRELDKIVSMPNKSEYIDNVCAPFAFDLPNPVSKRLFSLFDEGNRSNEILITMSHEITAILHYLLNSPDSWAYHVDRHKKIFRSRTSTAIIPVEWRDQGLNPDDIFRHSIERLRLQAMQKFKKTAEAEDPGSFPAG